MARDRSSPRSRPPARRSRSSKAGLGRKLSRVRLLLCDVDGVMTDGTVTMGAGGEFKQFGIQDGFGLVLLRRCGFRVGWISARPSPATRARAADLKIDFLEEPRDGKLAAAEKILAACQLKWDQVCFVGDDIVDLSPMKRVGVAVATANAVREVKRVADYVTTKPGGHGAVREVAEMILGAHNKWAAVIRELSV